MCGTSSYKAQLYLIDTQKEKRMEIGREWKLGDIKEGHAFMITDIAKRVSHSCRAKSHFLNIATSVFLSLYGDFFLPKST